ncbi:MAG: hypothetical protein ACLFMN_00625 [Desulfobacterales bacterium]
MNPENGQERKNRPPDYRGSFLQNHRAIYEVFYKFIKIPDSNFGLFPYYIVYTIPPYPTNVESGFFS